MNYEQAWNELKETLLKDTTRLKDKKEMLSGREFRRLRTFINGYKNALIFMKRIEKKMEKKTNSK